MSASYSNTLVSSLKSNVGIAVLTMPFAFSRAGWLGAGFLFASSGFLTAYAMHLFTCVLVDMLPPPAPHGRARGPARYQRLAVLSPLHDAELEARGLDTPPNGESSRGRGGIGGGDDEGDGADDEEDNAVAGQLLPPVQRLTFRSVAAASSDNHWFLVPFADWMLFIASLGVCIAYVGFVTQSAHQLAPSIPRSVFTVLLLIAYTGVALTERVSGALAKVSGLGVFVLLIGSAMFLVETWTQCGSSPEPLQPLDARSRGPPALVWATLAEAFGVAAFANEGIVSLAAPIYTEAEALVKSQYHRIAMLSIAVITVLNVTIGYSGLFCLPTVFPVFTEAMDLASPVNAVGVACLVLQVACTFPQVAFVMLQTLEGSILPQAATSTPLRRRVSRLLSIWLPCICGGWVDNVGAVVALFGGLGNAAVTFALPCLFYLFHFHGKNLRQHLLHTRQGWLIMFITVFALLGGVISTVVAYHDLTEPR